MFELIEKGNLKYYNITSFGKTGAALQCFSTRHGGVSTGCYASMNLRSHSGDDWKNVLENFGIITGAAGIDRGRLVLSKQVHEDNIIDVDESMCGNGILYKNKFKSADALITNRKNVPIAIFSADCVPVMLLDPKKGVIALAHSGWRGTVKEIARKTAEKMIYEYGSEPRDILAAIGPSVREENFEVGNDVAEIFIRSFGEETAVKYGQKYHVNMQKAISGQLCGAGIPPENIDDCGLCTAGDTELFYSHRRMGDMRGDMGAFLQLI